MSQPGNYPQGPQPSAYPQPASSLGYYPPGALPYGGPQRPAGEPIPRQQRKRPGQGLGLLIGLAVGAIAMLALALTGVVTPVKTTDTAAVALPATLPGVRLANDVVADLGGGGDERITANNEVSRTQTLEQLQAAYQGAGADVQFYSDDSFEFRLAVHAVRAPSPGLTLAAVVGASYLNLAVAPTTVLQYGEVQCQLAQLQTTAPGEAVDPQLESATVCQRADDELTVRAWAQTGNDGKVDETVAVVNAAWAAVS